MIETNQKNLSIFDEILRETSMENRAKSFKNRYIYRLLCESTDHSRGSNPSKSIKNRTSIIYDLFKQGLNLNDCNVVMMWTNKLSFQVSRQFNLIAQLNNTLAIIIRTDEQFYQETIASILKIKIELISKNIKQQKVKLEILKSTVGFTKKHHVILI